LARFHPRHQRRAAGDAARRPRRGKTFKDKTFKDKTFKDKTFKDKTFKDKAGKGVR